MYCCRCVLSNIITIIGFQTVYGELLLVNNNADVDGISRFVLTRLLNNPDIASDFAHPSVPHLYKPGKHLLFFAVK